MCILRHLAHCQITPAEDLYSCTFPRANIKASTLLFNTMDFAFPVSCHLIGSRGYIHKSDEERAAFLPVISEPVYTFFHSLFIPSAHFFPAEFNLASWKLSSVGPRWAFWSHPQMTPPQILEDRHHVSLSPSSTTLAPPALPFETQLPEPALQTGAQEALHTPDFVVTQLSSVVCPLWTPLPAGTPHLSLLAPSSCTRTLSVPFPISHVTAKACSPTVKITPQL